MCKQKRRKEQSPVETAYYLSRTFFCWMYPLFQKGAQKDLDVEDLYEVPSEDDTEGLGNKLEKEWFIQLEKAKLSGKKPSLFKAMMKSFGPKFMLISIWIVIRECVFRVGQPLLLGVILNYFQPDTTITDNEIWMYLGLFIIFTFFAAMLEHPYFFESQHYGMKLRVSCCTLMYRKALKLSQKSLGTTTVGHIVNLMSNDVNRFDMSVMFLHYLWVGPLQLLEIVGILYFLMGPSCLAGLALSLCLVPVQSTMGKLFSKFRFKTALMTDDRVRIMNEVISAMRVIKMYAWENSFAKIVAACRKKEIGIIRRTSYFRAINISIFFTSSQLIPFLTFIAFVLSNNMLTSANVYIALALYGNSRVVMTFFFPTAISLGAETMVSIKRIEKFLLMEEMNNPTIENIPPKPSEAILSVDKLTAFWTEKHGRPVLDNISFTLRPGQLLMVVGSVGSGKTSLFMSLLGELPLHSGTINMKGRMVYSSQEPWILGESLRENILFDSPMERERYKRVIKACALETDIEQLPQGDRTKAGERGSSFSGGQRARVNLARAVYASSDIYILDDPLSAVDAHVAHHLFYKCIKGYLKNKITILATHQLQFLKDADNILVLKDGACAAIGTYSQLLEQGVDFASLVAEDPEDQKSESFSLHRQTSVPLARSVSSDEGLDGYLMHDGRHDSLSYRHRIDSVPGLCPTVSDQENCGDFHGSVQSMEVLERGAVSIKVYYTYIKAMGGLPVALFLLLLYAISQVIYRGVDIWLANWTAREDELYRRMKEREEVIRLNGTINDPFNGTFPVYDEVGFSTDTYIAVYSGLMVTVFVCCLVRGISFFSACMVASTRLHNSMFGSVIRAPVYFFDTNPIGRLMNRFARDIGLIDDMLANCLFDTIEIFVTITGVLLVVCYVNFWILIPTTFLFLLFFYIRRFYLETARDVKRIEGITRSPVYSHLSNTLQGLVTIRSFRTEDNFKASFYEHQDTHSSAWYIFLAGTRFLGVILDLVCVVYISAVAASLILLQGAFSSSMAGLALVNAIALTGITQHGIRQSSEVESMMTSVERVVEYSTLESEADLEAPKRKKPPKSWPEEGTITFENVYLHYSDEASPVLKNLNCTFLAGEKIGIVGRTGAGKSSLITALFRLAEPRGNVCIDGIITAEIGLHDLRKMISIIPQEPVLFTGTMRKNLDPFLEKNDTELWASLEEVQLKDAVMNMAGGLDAEISEGGSNFSLGQRQLVCLARAILRKNKILILDEATANVDPDTDSLIQLTIREKFRNCTVITIAHRLHTIMDSDRVLVMDAGRIVQFDEPFNLLQQTEGIFYSMVQQTGKASAKRLREMAREARQSRMTRRNIPLFKDEDKDVEDVDDYGESVSLLPEVRFTNAKPATKPNGVNSSNL